MNSIHLRISEYEAVFEKIATTIKTFECEVLTPQCAQAASTDALFQSAKHLCSEVYSLVNLCSLGADIKNPKTEQFESAGPELAESQYHHHHREAMALRPKSAQSEPLLPSAMTMMASSGLSMSTSKPQARQLFLYSRNGLFPPLTSMGEIPRVMKDETIEYATSGFPQRLLRACAESGYWGLTTTTWSDEDIQPFFGLMLESLSRAEMVSFFERVLAVTPCAPIKDERIPFVCLGRSGTHFNASGAAVSLIEGQHNLSMFYASNGVREVPSDEDWFDVIDVERYLLHSAIQLLPDATRSLSNGPVTKGLLTIEESVIIKGKFHILFY